MEFGFHGNKQQPSCFRPFRKRCHRSESIGGLNHCGLYFVWHACNTNKVKTHKKTHRHNGVTNRLPSSLSSPLSRPHKHLGGVWWGLSIRCIRGSKTYYDQTTAHAIWPEWHAPPVELDSPTEWTLSCLAQLAEHCIKTVRDRDSIS